MTDALDECFAQFTHSAVRLETLQTYSVPGEAERIAAWKAGRPRPERSVRTNGYLREVAEHVIAGRQRARIRIVDEPLSEYVRYQITGYLESQAAGEEIEIAVRQGANTRAMIDLGALTDDFWLFDQNYSTARAILMRYDGNGQLTGMQAATYTEVNACRQAWGYASRHTVSLNEYLAAGHATTAVA